jgi:predicted O-methyltransferase YrrM
LLACARAVDGFLERVMFNSRLEAHTIPSALSNSVSHRLPAIHVPPSLGVLLESLASKSSRVLEIGTLGGVSTIHIGKGVEKGAHFSRDLAQKPVVSLEISPQNAQIARDNLARAGLSHLVEVIEGDAHGSIDSLLRSGCSFDLVFIDADKASSRDYFAKCAEMMPRGAVVVVDNVVRDGALADDAEAEKNAAVRGAREVIKAAAEDKRFISTVIQTVGAKGYDGFLFAVKI